MVAMEAPVEATVAAAESAGFDEFFAANYPSVVRSLTLATGDQGRAEDLAQDAFAKACRRWRRVSVMARPATWVYVVAVNADRRRFRRDARSLDASPVVDTVADGSGSVVARLVVRDALDRLAPRQRMAVVLRFLVGLQLNEIADAMGCAEGTVKSTISAALARLRVDLEELEEEVEE